MQREKTPNARSIFWRLCLRSLQVKRPQAMLAIGSLIVGAAVCSLLLSLYGGVQRKMTESFRAFGANVILAPQETASASSDLPSIMTQPDPERLSAFRYRWPGFNAVSALYAVTRLTSAQSGLPGGQNVLVVGTNLALLRQMNPGWRFQNAGPVSELHACVVGIHIAEMMRLHSGDSLRLQTLSAASSTTPPAAPLLGKERTQGWFVGQDAAATFHVAAVVSTGASEDDQVFVPLPALQQMTGLKGKISAVELRVPGDASQIESAVRQLRGAFPEARVSPIRQIVYSEGKVLATVRRLLLALTVLVLVIIVLCVGATMTAIVLERRKDIAVMKALGASDRLVMELFLGEGAALGLTGGLAGFFVGAAVARSLALHLFHVAIEPAAWMFPPVCLATIALAVIATLFPVRIVRGVRPATTLKGA